MTSSSGATENNSSNHPNEEEVSAVLQHFQPRPDSLLIYNDTTRRLLSRGAGNRKRRQPAAAQGFASIRYYQQQQGRHHPPTLRLAYLGRRSGPLLFFAVSCDAPHAVTWLNSPCGLKNPVASQPAAQPHWLVGDLCSTLTRERASLFAVVSRLLRALNELEEAAPLPDDTRKVWQRQQQQQPLLDLAVLLWRYAAVSRKRATLCAPVPPFWTQQQQDSLLNEDAALALANHIVALPDLVLANQHSDGDGDGSGSSPNTTQDCSTWLAFFFSLPWVEQGTLTSCSANLNSRRRGNIHTFQWTLDLQSSAGDPSPRWKSLAQQHGTIAQAYHGTHMERLWSILYYGLQNLSDNTILSEHNGTLLGEGVYFSTCKDVASFFAQQANLQNKPTTTNNPVWHHPAFARLLQQQQLKQSPSEETDPPPVPISSLWPNIANISCFPVLEAHIIAPPSDTNNAMTSSSSSTTRQEGKYYVVPNPENVRLHKLHLTIEVLPAGKRRPPLPSSKQQLSDDTSSSPLWFYFLSSFLVGIVAMLWIVAKQ
jgi:hypothetical protein